MFCKLFISALCGICVGLLYGFFFLKQLFYFYQKPTDQTKKNAARFFLLYLIRYITLIALCVALLINFALNVLTFIFFFGLTFLLSLLNKVGKKV